MNTIATDNVKINNQQKSVPQSKTWVNINIFPLKGDRNYRAILEAYLQPVWHTREIYDESALIVGKCGYINLLYVPKSKVLVRNYNLSVVYKEGIDYIVDGRKIVRIDGGNLPYFEVDDYYMVQANHPRIALKVNPLTSRVKFDEERYLWFGEGEGITNKQITISYQTDDLWRGKKPIAKSQNVQKFISKVKCNKQATVLFYGDSITVGCNASGTIYGGNKPPYLPAWYTLICSWMEEKYSANITVINKAVGGWSVKNGAENFKNALCEISTEVDLLVLAFGMNDGFTDTSTFKEKTLEICQEFLKVNPNGEILLVSTMQPNQESATWVKNQGLFEDLLLEIEKEYNCALVAPVSSIFKVMEKDHGKATRDWLVNNINHPNDFGVRVYAHTLLYTIFGEEFCKD